MLGKSPNTILQAGLALALWATYYPSQKAGPPQPPAKLTRTDSSVLTAVLRDVVGPRARTSRDIVLVLANKTAKSTLQMTDEQLKSDTNGHEIPPDVREDMRRRNPGKLVDLSAYRPNPRDVIVAEVYGTDSQGGPAYIDPDAFEERFPTAEAYIIIWLPGYSKDGNLAALRYVSSARPHGGMGTYLLKKQGSQWKVVWRAIVSFL